MPRLCLFSFSHFSFFKFKFLVSSFFSIFRILYKDFVQNFHCTSNKVIIEIYFMFLNKWIGKSIRHKINFHVPKRTGCRRSGGPGRK